MVIQTSQAFEKQAKVFQGLNVNKADVARAGENTIILLYKGHLGDQLDLLRLQRFHQKVGSGTSCVKPEVLPPTSGATKYHSWRVYLQVQQWIGNAEHMNAEDWGWYEHGGHYLPVMTDKAAAPSELLDIIRCNCKTGCSTKQC